MEFVSAITFKSLHALFLWVPKLFVSDLLCFLEPMNLQCMYRHSIWPQGKMRPSGNARFEGVTAGGLAVTSLLATAHQLMEQGVCPQPALTRPGPPMLQSQWTTVTLPTAAIDHVP